MSVRRLGIAAVAAALAAVAAPASQAAGPTAIATGNDGTVYAGFASGGVKRYRAADGEALSNWQTQVADEDGTLGGIVAMEASASGGVWVLDANRRVQEFTREGGFVRGFRLGPCESSNDPAPGSKGGLEVTAAAVYVAHPCADAIERYATADLPGTGTGSPGSITTAIYWPHGIAAPLSATAEADSQALYVTQPRSSAIRRFDLTTLAQIGDAVPITHTGSPEDVHLSGDAGDGRILVSEAANADPGYAHRVYAFGSGGGSFPELFNFGGLGAAPGRLNDAVALDSAAISGGTTSAVVVADRQNERVQRLTATAADNGNVVWVSAAQDPGAPPRPSGGGDGGDGGAGGGDDGVSRDPRVEINGGARYTARPEVTLTLDEPRGTERIEIANDPDFETEERFPAGSDPIGWRLDPDAPDRVRRRVFVRFQGSGRGVVSDEIRLDRGRPRIRTARIVRGKSGPFLRVVASDAGSGLSEVRFAPKPGGPFEERSFEVRTPLESKRDARFVRVADLVGNVSKLERSRRD